jgi:hypothetical protein
MMISALTRTFGRKCAISAAAKATSAVGSSQATFTVSTSTANVGSSLNDVTWFPSNTLASFTSEYFRHPSAPVTVGWVDIDKMEQRQEMRQQQRDAAAEEFDDDDDIKPEEIQVMNRNARHPKKANRGARPCSRVARRAKKRAIGNHRR